MHSGMSQNIAIRIVRTILSIATVILAAVTLVCGLVMVQGQRDERRRVDMIVVVASPTPDAAHLDHAVALYQHGYAARILVVGESLDQVREALLERGMRDSAILGIEHRETDIHGLVMREVAAMAHQQSLESVLLVSAPGELLLHLKMAHDVGLTAYGSPVPGIALDARAVLHGSLRYWNYVLFGQA